MLHTLVKEKIQERFNSSFSKEKSLLSTKDTSNNSIIVDTTNITTTHICEWATTFSKLLSKYIPENAKCFVAGGSVLTYILYGNLCVIEDFDIFPTTIEDFNLISKHLENLKEKNNGTIYTTENADRYNFNKLKIDLVKQPTESIVRLLDNFDINICKVGFVVHENWKFVLNTSFFEIFSGFFTMKTNDSILGFQRFIKYIKKGFVPRQETMVELYASILTKKNKLGVEEQKKLLEEIYNEVGFEKTYNNLK